MRQTPTRPSRPAVFLVIAICAFGALCIPGGTARAADNLLKDGDFSQPGGPKGAPASWECAGGESVTQTLSREDDPEHGPCAKLQCTRLANAGPDSHAMVDQRGTAALRAGQWYHVSLWARQQGINAGSVSLAVSETRDWRDTGIHEAFRPTGRWRRFEFDVRSNIDVAAERSRFQIWFTSTGTLWLADVRFAEGEPPRRSHAPLLETRGRKNLVPNSSFECGTTGWGSVTEELSSWGNLDALVGRIDPADAATGKCSLRVTTDEKAASIAHFDYFHARDEAVRSPLAANAGWIPVEKGAADTLSAYLKADRPGAAAVLALYFGNRPSTKTVSLTGEWQRYSLSVEAPDESCFVAIGPAPRAAGGAGAGAGTAAASTRIGSGTLWIDGVQLEKGSSPTAYEPADPVEVGVETRGGGRVFAEGDDVSLVTTASNHSDAPATAKVSVHFEDFFDADAGTKQIELPLPPHGRAEATIETGLKRKGFYRALVHTDAADRQRDSRLRLALIAPYPATAKDSVFGMNHAYPWDREQTEARQVGLLWVRDWSLKWQDVEPVKGSFTFAAADRLIDRDLALAGRVDLLLPFPSADWSSSAPPTVPAAKQYPASRRRAAFAPRDPGEFADYVAACVAHYKDCTTTWEVLNEPLFTDYALPRGARYSAEDYVGLLKAARAAAKRTDPRAFLIGGIAGGDTQLGLYQDFAKAGGLDLVDALNIHVYPGLSPPESQEAWPAKLNDLMRSAGKPRPIWMTEFGYYAEDEPSTLPLKWEMPVLESEKQCAAWYVRLNTIMLANHVEKLFYHAGAASRLNAEGLEGIFLRYGGEPRKMLSAQSAMADLFVPPTRFVEKLPAPPGLHAYLFETPSGPLLVAWAEEGARGRIELRDARLTPLDIQGNEIAGRVLALTEYPIYVRGRSVDAGAAGKAVRLTPE